MEQYIKKSAVVAEIKRRIKKYASIDVGDSRELDALYGAKCHALTSILSSLDTLEVKEMPDSNDLEQEIENELERTWCGEYLDTDKFKESAVYFFELGLKAKGE